uniref:Uncharacterized protein n=1 Tax=Arundo donax TaxID=35708 RepID=A0A0A9D9J8_ARUDO
MSSGVLAGDGVEVGLGEGPAGEQRLQQCVVPPGERASCSALLPARSGIGGLRKETDTANSARDGEVGIEFVGILG